MKFLALSSIALLLSQQVLAKPAEGCLQNHTITGTDSCVSVAAQFQITEPEFYAMNPGLHHSVQHDCDNLDSGKPFCVCMTSPCAVAGVAPAASSAETNSTASSANQPTVASSISSSSSFSLSSSSAASSAARSSAAPSSAAPSSAAASSATPSSAASTGTTPSGSVSASPQTSASKNSASMTTAISAITIGLVMTATAMLF